MSQTSLNPVRNRVVTPASKATRVQAVDAYRGLVMLLMMAEVLQLAKVSAALPGNTFWRFAAYNQTHVEWTWLSLHDMIQPSFSFLVGVAMPFSVASRMGRGQSFKQLFGHTVTRSLVLIALGIVLRSIHAGYPYFTFEDTLTQIGLGYTFLFLLAFLPERSQWLALGAGLFAYWLAWALYPVPGPAFNWPAVGVPADWTHHLSGFAAHWDKNSNFGTAFDQWFLNLFWRPAPFVANGGGYLTLSFIPTLGTMLLGLIAGRWLKQSAPGIPFRKFLLAAAACLAAGLLLHFTGVCPIVKRIWTPAWTLFSGGLCFLALAAFSWLVDVKGYRQAAFPLLVIGRNSIAAYVMAELAGDYISRFLYLPGHGPFAIFGTAFDPFLHGLTILLIFWMALWLLYRRHIFLRI